MQVVILRQVFEQPISGYWDGGPKSEFHWTIDRLKPRNNGNAVVGSWSANAWFQVKLGKTEKGTLGNARRALAARAKRYNRRCTFEYLQEEW